jgi:putative ABC transport system permease protein
VSVLDHKLLRDLWRLRGQVLAIALVMASGVATYVLSHTTIDSLRLTQQAFYREGRFADVFISLKRAPQAVEQQIAAVPGIRQVETRVSAYALIDMPDFADPVSAMVLSLPDPAIGLNRLYLRAGRLPEGDYEVAVNEAFAEAHKLHPGAELSTTINGHRRRLVVTGIVLSPEFVYLIRLGDVFPDYKRYGVLWMPREPLAAAQGMDGAFNSAVLTLQQDASPGTVVTALDDLLAPWGSAGAVLRKDQISHRYLSDEIRQLEAQAQTVPLVFLGVAAFLLNVVLSRIIAQERIQIAILKAFGYGTAAIAAHYLRLVMLIVIGGAALGLWLGAELGSGLASMYSKFFRYPFLRFHFEPGVALTGVLIGAAAALTGTLFAVLRAAMLPPAAGMRPEPPPLFRRTLLDSRRLRRWLPPSTRMILRNIARRPLKSALTTVGIALAAAILTVGGFMQDAVNAILDVQFGRAHRAELTVSFSDVTSASALHELAALPGVRAVEPVRGVSIRLRSAQRERRLAVQGLQPDPVLHRLLSAEYRPLDIPDDGLLLTDHLADYLQVRPGDRILVEVLEGARPVREWPVLGVVHDLTGYSAYMDLDTLNRWLKDGNVVSGAFLQVDRDAVDRLYAELKKMPRVIGVMNRRVALNSFKETMGENLLIFAVVNLLLASAIAVGVVYNSMRVTLSERERELASLRVLGFTRSEASYLLLGEMVLLTAAAIPLGLWLGHSFCSYLARRLASDLYRIPVVIEPKTYAYAALVVIVTTFVSSLIMIHNVRQLRPVEALKVPQ